MKTRRARRRDTTRYEVYAGTKDDCTPSDIGAQRYPKYPFPDLTKPFYSFFVPNGKMARLRAAVTYWQNVYEPEQRKFTCADDRECTCTSCNAKFMLSQSPNRECPICGEANTLTLGAHGIKVWRSQ